MSYGELTLAPTWTGINKQNGQFLKGHVPANKGKKWNEYMGKRAQKRAAKGWKNLELHRPKSRPDTAGRCRKQVVAIRDDGSWCVLPFLGAAAEWCGGRRENVRRCCQNNSAHHVNKKTGRINTDHCYMGIRFYYESDNIWTEKINTLGYDTKRKV